MSESTLSNKPPKRYLSDDNSLDSRENRKVKTDDERDAMDVDAATSHSSIQHLLEDAEIPEDFLTIVNAELPSDYPINTAARARTIISLCMILDLDQKQGILSQMSGQDILELVRKNPEIMDICQDAVTKGDARNIFRLKPLRKKPMPRLPYEPDLLQSSMIAAESSWTVPYQGGAANALWSYLVNHFQPSGAANSKQPPLPDHCAAIIQSSGMGKSRAVDELAKTHFVIPINVRAYGSSGYPPPDEDVRNFLSQSDDQQVGARRRSEAFLLALFEVTEHILSGGTYDGKVLKFDAHPEDSAEDIAAKFREYMAEDMDFNCYGRKRNWFFRVVVRKANERSASHQPRIRLNGAIEDAFAKLVKAIKGKPNTLSHANEGPQVVIMFDEAHTLSQPKKGIFSFITSDWNALTELCRCLRDYRRLSLFSLFLSTTGDIDQFIFPKSNLDPSSRILADGYSVNRPYIDLGFDQLAIKLKSSENIELSSVVTDEHIARYGRPLWGSIFTSQVYGLREIQDHIIVFTAMKLLGGVQYDYGLELDIHQRLACLSWRLPIEFDTTHPMAKEQQLKHVAAHMRVILKAEAHFENMVTVCPSEPILSEAAYYVMQRSQFDVASTLRDVLLGGFAVRKDDRGQLIIMLLFTLARDAAVPLPDFLLSPIQRWCSVPHLLSCLFLPKKTTVLEAKEQIVGPNPEDSVPISKELQNTFSDSKVYCSHFIKVHQFEIVGVKYLVKLLARGAGILCANNHTAIDGVIPVLLKGSRLTADNIAAIIWRGKNDGEHSAEPDLDLFKVMDPYHTKVFDKDCDIPVIRIVFALAAEKPSLEIVNISESISGKRYRTYDIWAAGLSPEIFGAISAENVSIWDALWQASSGLADIYSGASPEELALRKMENPGAV